MKLHRPISITALFIGLFLLTGCGAGQAAQATATPYPTYTAYPTYTVPPTLAPTETATQPPAYNKFTSAQVVSVFQAAGLEVGETWPMTQDDLGLAPYVMDEGTRFLIPSLGPDKGGRIMSFSSEEELRLMENYYLELGKQSALFFSWTFVHENILVQITSNLPEETARQYEAALNSMK